MAWGWCCVIMGTPKLTINGHIRSLNGHLGKSRPFRGYGWFEGKRFLVYGPEMGIATRLTLQEFTVIFKADGFLFSAFQARVDDNGLFRIGDFQMVHKGFQPQRLVSVFTG